MGGVGQSIIDENIIFLTLSKVRTNKPLHVKLVYTTVPLKALDTFGIAKDQSSHMVYLNIIYKRKITNP